MPVALPRPTGLLHCPIPREGSIPHRAGGAWLVEVLAQDVFSKGGHVLGRDRGDFGRHRSAAVCQDPGAAVPSNCQMRFESTLSGKSVQKLYLKRNKSNLLSDRLLSGLYISGTMSTPCRWSRRTTRLSCPSCSRPYTASARSTGIKPLSRSSTTYWKRSWRWTRSYSTNWPPATRRKGKSESHFGQFYSNNINIFIFLGKRSESAIARSCGRSCTNSKLIVLLGAPLAVALRHPTAQHPRRQRPCSHPAPPAWTLISNSRIAAAAAACPAAATIILRPQTPKSRKSRKTKREASDRREARQKLTINN